jgi:N-acetylmuramoyl-L-alanine amidase
MPVLGRKNLIAGAVTAAAVGAMMIPLSLASETLLAAPLGAPVLSGQASLIPAVAEQPAIEAPVTPTLAVETIAPADTVEANDVEAAALDPELECMAKVVYHEAANQPRKGQLAVAQLIMNRVQSGRFAATPCAVANQRGQFFQTSAYNPPRDDRWATAVSVAREARDGTADDVTEGAMFYRVASQRAPQGRARVAVIGAHAFYR